MSTTMMITVKVVTASHPMTRASSTASNDKESANKSSNYWSAGKIIILLFCQKR